MTIAPGVSLEFSFPVGKLNNLTIFSMRPCPKTYVEYTKKDKNALKYNYFYYKHIGNPVAFNLAERVETSMDFAANRSTGLSIVCGH